MVTQSAGLRYNPQGKNHVWDESRNGNGHTMAQVDLTIEQLSLDSDNPRINSASSQREALQKMVSEEPEKFVRLARSIVRHGLSPMDRLLVYRPKGTRNYTVLEGNRRAAALKVLVNPTCM